MVDTLVTPPAPSFHLELPGVPHHEVKVRIVVDGGAEPTVVVDKLFLRHLLCVCVCVCVCVRVYMCVC